MILLHHIRPAPLRGLFNSSEVWDKEVAFEKGKHYLVTAPSGKGKSTFLHLIYGLRKDFEGQLSINGKETNSFSPLEWSNLRTSMLSIIFQDLRLFEDLTSMTNIRIKNQLTEHKTADEIHQMATQLGISDLLDQQVHQLSYGQRQRVAIIRALCQPFDYLLMDEPFSHLDEQNTELARTLILDEVQKQKAGVILTSLGSDSGFDFHQQIQL